MRHKLLLADDSVTIQRVIELTFADEDVQVIVVGDGRQAIARIESDRPDIVLADIGMPERDGYEVAAFVKGTPHLAGIPVVLLTGAFEPLDEDRARSVGCDGVFVKPFEPQLVINRVKELLAGRQSRQPAAATGAFPAHEAAPEPAPRQGAPGPASRQAALEPAHRRAAAEPAPLQAAMAPAASRDGPELDPDWDMPAHAARSAAAPAGEVRGDVLEEYFDRLDAAFASVAAPPSTRATAPGRDDPGVGGHLEQPHQERAPSPADAPTGWDLDLPAGVEPDPQPYLAEAFAGLLAAEEGLGDLQAVAGPPPPVAISAELVERIAERVIARMGDESMRRAVTDTAERLVREEIDRIKRVGGSGPAQSAG